MEIGPDKIADLRVKQLEMVQAIVARVAGNGASLKNWCITVTTAVCGFAISVQRPLVALVAVVFILLFALLDAQYLRVERQFRALFAKLRSEDWRTFPSFEIDLTNAPHVSYSSVLPSWSTSTSMYRSRSRLRSWCLLRGASMGSDPKRPSGLFDFILPPSPPKDDSLAGLLGGLAPLPPGRAPPRQSYSLLDLARVLDPSPPRNPAGNPFDFLPPSPPRTSNPFGSLIPSSPSVGNFLDFPVPSPPPRRAAIPAAEPKKRRAFFSFHFDDVRRSVIVRNAWKFTDPENNSFVDSSLWEKSKLRDPETIKQLIRDGVSFTSVACVLVGSGTWLRRWVRYEIARAIIDGLGLLAVHLNSIRDPNTRTTLPSGLNPLSYMAVGKVQVNAWEPVRYFLFERELNVNTWKFEWARYEDYTHQVKLPRWLPDPAPGFVTPLAPYAGEYDYMIHQGHTNIGTWLDRAARQAGR